MLGASFRCCLLPLLARQGEAHIFFSRKKRELSVLLGLNLLHHLKLHVVASRADCARLRVQLVKSI